MTFAHYQGHSDVGKVGVKAVCCQQVLVGWSSNSVVFTHTNKIIHIIRLSVTGVYLGQLVTYGPANRKDYIRAKHNLSNHK